MDCTCPFGHVRRQGTHRPECPMHMPSITGLIPEHRAVFSYPSSILGPTPDTYGPWRRSLQEAARDRAPSPEETYGWRSGFQKRLVTEPRPEKVYAELDGVPIQSDPQATDVEKTLAARLHGTWIDQGELIQQKVGESITATLSTSRTGAIVYREDGQPAEVYVLRRDWNKR